LALALLHFTESSKNIRLINSGTLIVINFADESPHSDIAVDVSHIDLRKASRDACEDTSIGLHSRAGLLGALRLT